MKNNRMGPHRRSNLRPWGLWFLVTAAGPADTAPLPASPGRGTPWLGSAPGRGVPFHGFPASSYQTGRHTGTCAPERPAGIPAFPSPSPLCQDAPVNQAAVIIELGDDQDHGVPLVEVPVRVLGGVE